MTPAEFRAWQAHMGLTVRATAELLDVSPSTVQAYRTGISRSTGQPVAVPRVVALACAALAAGLKPWEPPRTPSHAGGAGLRAPPK